MLYTADSQPSTQQAASSPTPSGSQLCTQQADATPMPLATAYTGEPQRKLLPKVPQVCHRYVQLCYPWKGTSPCAGEVSALNSKVLEHLPAFSEVRAGALKLMLDLSGPVALVATNGSSFDFLLQMAELNKVGEERQWLSG